MLGVGPCCIIPCCVVWLALRLSIAHALLLLRQGLQETTSLLHSCSRVLGRALLEALGRVLWHALLVALARVLRHALLLGG